MSAPKGVPCHNIHHVISAVGLTNRFSLKDTFLGAPCASLILSIDFNLGLWGDSENMQLGVSILDPTLNGTEITFRPIQTHHFAMSASPQNDKQTEFRYGRSANCLNLEEIIACLRSVIPEDRYFIVILHHRSGIDANIINFLSRLPYFWAFVNIYPTRTKKFRRQRDRHLHKIAQSTCVPFCPKDMSCAGNSAHFLLQATLEIARRIHYNACFFCPPELEDIIRIRSMWEVAMDDTRRPIQDVKTPPVEDGRKLPCFSMRHFWLINLKLRQRIEGTRGQDTSPK